MKGAALLLVLIAAGCYRGEPPPPLPEGAAVTVATNRGRLVRSQAYLQSEIAAACSRELGWRVGPTGGATLELAIEEESIDVQASGDLGIPERWRVTLRGGWTLRSTSYEDQSGDFSATGYYEDRSDENAALREAAASVARNIAGTLRRRLSDLQPAPERGDPIPSR